MTVRSEGSSSIAVAEQLSWTCGARSVDVKPEREHRTNPTRGSCEGVAATGRVCGWAFLYLKTCNTEC